MFGLIGVWVKCSALMVVFALGVVFFSLLCLMFNSVDLR